uniref:Uncharacterized protein n=1 Tax=Cacopsylla melanoneura TaxID=428564 RepID=A0A8D8ZPD7_9HEMI
MECHTVLVFIGLFIIPVFASSVKEELLNKLIGSQKDLLRVYEKYLDNTVAFKEFRGSLQQLHELNQDYNGRYQADIYSATSIGFKSIENYYRATDIIFRWCAFMSRQVNNLLSNGNTINEYFNIMLSTTKSAVKAVTEGHVLLELVRDDLTMMQNILRPIPSSLSNELDQYKNKYAEGWNDPRTKRALDCAQQSVENFVVALPNFIINIVYLIPSDARAKIRGMCQRQKQENRRQKRQNQDDANIEIVKEFYTALIKGVQKVQDSGKKVQEELKAEITKVNELLGDFDVVELLGEEIGSFCEDELQDLLKSVTDYMDRHSHVDESASEFYTQR